MWNRRFISFPLQADEFTFDTNARENKALRRPATVWRMFLLYLLLQSRFQTQHRLKDVLLEGRWMENVPRAFTKHWKKGVKNQRVHVGVSVSIPANRSGSWRTTSESVDSGSECWSYPFPLKTKCQMLAVVFLFCFFLPGVKCVSLTKPLGIGL